MESRPDSSANIPAWFHTYAIENERQHAALQQRIAEVDTRVAGVETRIAEVETRLVRWVVGSAGVAAGVVVALTQVLDS